MENEKITEEQYTENKITVGNNIRNLRRYFGMKQEEFAKCLNISQSALSIYERGDKFPPISMILKLSEMFHISPEQILGWPGHQPEPSQEVNQDPDQSQ